MVVMAGTSDQVNLRKLTLIEIPAKQRAATRLDRGPVKADRRGFLQWSRAQTEVGAGAPDWLAPIVAHDAQQEQEDVDEVEIELQRTHHGILGQHVATKGGRVAVLDLLGIPGG